MLFRRLKFAAALSFNSPRSLAQFDLCAQEWHRRCSTSVRELCVQVKEQVSKYFMRCRLTVINDVASPTARRCRWSLGKPATCHCTGRLASLIVATVVPGSLQRKPSAAVPSRKAHDRRPAATCCKDQQLLEQGRADGLDSLSASAYSQAN